MLYNFLQSFINIFIDMSAYIMLGLFLVGIINAFVNRNFVKKQIGTSSTGSVIKAAIVGVPLPLCSCGVVPTALGLKKEGASDGAVTSFLISTPQTGVDSIIATYGMLGIFMAIYRALVAFVSGIIGGVLTNWFGKDKDEKLELPKVCCHDCCSKSEDSCCQTAEEKPTFIQKLKSTITYPFGDFLDELSIHFLIGLVVAALIDTLIPKDFFTNYGLSNGILSYLLMMIIGIPMYICSTSSIPVAMTLMMKGISPGAAFVFLFAGPVTNAASIIVLYKSLKKRVIAIYIASVFACSLIFGALLDLLTKWLSIDINQQMNHSQHSTVSILGYILAAIFAILIIKGIIKLSLKKYHFLSGGDKSPKNK